MGDIEFHKIKKFNQITTDTVAYIRKHYKLLSKVLLLFTAPLFIVQAYLVSGIDINTAELFDDPENFNLLEEFFGPRYLISVAISLIANCILSVLIIKHVAFTANNEEVDFVDLTQYLFIYAANFFVLYFFIGFIISLSAMFFILPAIFIGVHLALAPAALQIEQQGILNAMSRSWRLVKGNWWLTFGIVVILYAVISIIAVIGTVPVAILSSVIAEFANLTGETLDLITAITTGITAVLASLLYSAIHIALSIYYYSLVEQKN